MTGYGEARVDGSQLRVSVSIRTVNHRFLDLSVRIPEAYRGFELELTKLIKKTLARGRAEVRYRTDSAVDTAQTTRVRRDVISGYIEASRSIARDEGLEGTLGLGDLLRLPEAIAVTAPEESVGEDELSLFVEATGAALAGVVATRAEEGRKLAEILLRHIEGLDAVQNDLAKAVPEARKALAESLGGRLEELLGERGIEPERLAQEAAVLAERADVQEELDRLQVHLESFRSLVARAGEKGKRMEFLSQEILRELNTLGSKCRNTGMAERVVDGKVICEQIREQIQNVE
ncbi:MAG: YicC family protein [Acidobacteriota bacterium]|nr:YicC family protein [Acidobacteriota bacterium]